MTKKDYELLAKVLVQYKTGNPINKLHLVDALALELGRENIHFDHVQFQRACGT